MGIGHLLEIRNWELEIFITSMSINPKQFNQPPKTHQREITIFVSPQRGLILFLILIILIVFLGSVLYLTGQKYLAAIYYGQGMTISETASPNRLDQAIAKFIKTVNLDRTNDRYYRGLSWTYMLKLNEMLTQPTTNPAREQAQFQNILSSAISLGRQATTINSKESLNWLNLGSIYENIIPLANGADELAFESYKKVIELEPLSPAALVDLARAYLVSADKIRTELNTSSQPTPDKNNFKERQNLIESHLNEALKQLNLSLSLKGDYSPAHFLMAQVYERQNNLSGAIEKLKTTQQFNPMNWGLAFQLGLLYYKNNQLNEAQRELEKTVLLNDNYSNARYFLGLTYDRSQEKQKALAQFKKIGELNPDNQEVKKIIDNLEANRSALENIVPPATPPQQRTEVPVPEEKKER